VSDPHPEQDIIKLLTEIFLFAETLSQCGAVLLNTGCWPENSDLLLQWRFKCFCLPADPLIYQSYKALKFT